MKTIKRNEIQITWSKRTRLVIIRPGRKGKIVVRPGDNMHFENKCVHFLIGNHMTQQ